MLFLKDIREKSRRPSVRRYSENYLIALWNFVRITNESLQNRQISTSSDFFFPRRLNRVPERNATRQDSETPDNLRESKNRIVLILRSFVVTRSIHGQTFTVPFQK